MGHFGVQPQFKVRFSGVAGRIFAAAWNRSIEEFRQDLKAMQNLVTNPKIDLFARIPWGDGQTILREALLLADHNAYHLGQFVDLRRLLGAWKG